MSDNFFNNQISNNSNNDIYMREPNDLNNIQQPVTISLEKRQITFNIDPKDLQTG